jgi:hypothetical protein
LRRIEKPEPLPDVATSWKAPALDVEQGRCWATLQRLPEAVLEATRREAMARNRDWSPLEPSIDPFTGHLTSIESPRLKEALDSLEPVELSDEVFETRKLSRLRRNADLFGLKPADLDAVHWTPIGFNLMAAKRASPRIGVMGTIRCQDEAGRLAAGKEPCWTISVGFLRDGSVSAVRVYRYGAPVEVCSSPAIDAAKARAGGDAMDAKARARWRELKKWAHLGEPRLSIKQWREDSSTTWRLTWTVRLGGAEFFVDAVSGKSAGFWEMLTPNCFPPDDLP